MKKRGYQPESLVDTYHALVQKGKQRAAEVNRLKESEEKRKQLALHVKELEVQLEEVQKEKREMEMTYHSIEKEYIELRTSYEYNQQKTLKTYKHLKHGNKTG